MVDGAGFLTETWQDALAVIGVVGTVATIVALIITMWQLRRTMKASERVDRAVRKNLESVKAAFAMFAIGNCKRLLNEAKPLVDQAAWPLAALRLSDLADQTAQLHHVAAVEDEGWTTLINEMRSWEGTFRRLQSGDLAPGRSLTRKWLRFVGTTAAVLDKHHRPFNTATQEGDHESR